ncbi:MAG: hypothetical protein FH753_04330 [Firmicutes bacterium]|nr:hypothetical protein [Bacillota bacterium]
MWGNCYFTEKILSHELCLDNIIKKGNYELEKYSPLARGKVSIKLPNITFKDEEVCFFYSPGHTKDSASLYDISDNVLFVGDNIEYPIPLIYYNNLKKYKKTFLKYALLEPDIFVLSHGNPDE